MDVIFLDGGIGRTDDIKPVGRDILERYRHFARRIGKGADTRTVVSRSPGAYHPTA